jgi:hypothetical protein
MSVEQSVEWELAGKTEVLGENLPQRYFVHHRSHMTRPGIEPGRRGGKPATNRLSYGTVFCYVYTQLYVSVDIRIRVHCFSLTVKGYSSTFD